jgi:hypothetical protein
MQETQHFNVPNVVEYKNEKDHHQQLLQVHENKKFMKTTIKYPSLAKKEKMCLKSQIFTNLMKLLVLTDHESSSLHLLQASCFACRSIH